MPMRRVFACALATHGAATKVAVPPAKSVRRVTGPLIELHLPVIRLLNQPVVLCPDCRSARPC